MNNPAGRSNRWYPHVTVACVAEKQGKFLMVKESCQGKSVINQPAGHIEQGETLLQAVTRETKEETGWDFEPHSICGVYLFVAGNGETYLRFAFLGELIHQDSQHTLDPAIDEVVWMSKNELEYNKTQLRNDVVLKCIEDYQSGNILPLSIVQTLKLTL